MDANVTDIFSHVCLACFTCTRIEYFVKRTFIVEKSIELGSFVLYTESDFTTLSLDRTFYERLSFRSHITPLKVLGDFAERFANSPKPADRLLAISLRIL
jgi:hypothetical protein